jgi:hypothetical protein
MRFTKIILIALLLILPAGPALVEERKAQEKLEQELAKRAQCRACDTLADDINWRCTTQPPPPNLRNPEVKKTKCDGWRSDWESKCGTLAQDCVDIAVRRPNQ